jgi:hypothetical protein
MSLGKGRVGQASVESEGVYEGCGQLVVLEDLERETVFWIFSRSRIWHGPCNISLLNKKDGAHPAATQGAQNAVSSIE